ncbi:MAG: helix-turn-helix transcriptional regulator [Nitrosomonadales bacterium]|nr:helix-turn-helix transcriptional regulator [Nitrosomonadales bacterium]
MDEKNNIEVAERLREFRLRIGLKQDEAAAKFDIAYSTYKRYEGAKIWPDSEVVAKMVGLGLNANWLLTGEGSMLLADLKAADLDMSRFLLAIEAVEEGLEASNRTMTPTKKAELFLAVYDMMEEPTITKERVLKLVKLAA